MTTEDMKKHEFKAIKLLLAYVSEKYPKRNFQAIHAPDGDLQLKFENSSLILDIYYFIDYQTGQIKIYQEKYIKPFVVGSFSLENKKKKESTIVNESIVINKLLNITKDVLSSDPLAKFNFVTINSFSKDGKPLIIPKANYFICLDKKKLCGCHPADEWCANCWPVGFPLTGYTCNIKKNEKIIAKTED
jgi:hypothetical protein